MKIKAVPRRRTLSTGPGVPSARRYLPWARARHLSLHTGAWGPRAAPGAPDVGFRDRRVAESPPQHLPLPHPQAILLVRQWAQVGPGLVAKSPQAGSPRMWCQVQPRI